ncbi:MAG: CBS domain-containing protein [Candidatus Manganitrophus sp.]|nr:CBS domain-containing protein [Candidatus Manganitrophus sp.]WDT72465.1 MAG: CBS domain-containing protein [Candidatus Manganitrophus sp.]WDT75299.1 MAG: CBS domain-containing protein [Candidatus Manganitrophus sp.]WDT80082.1 MAG: CBS domain-containing protein [Candidatus Manganitrophus sp.]
MRPKYQTVGEIKKGNTLFTREGSSAFDVSSLLLDSHESGMPVVSEDDRVVGFISEQDILMALRGTRRLEEIAVREIMNPVVVVAEENATLEEASRAMEDLHIHRLPVVRGERLIGTITRNDLIRAWLGMNVEV